MGSTQQAEYANSELFSREVGLQAHIQGNFYPPHPPYVVKSMTEGFKQYWKGDIGLKELKEKCYLRDMDGLYKYFGEFLNEEDID